MALDMHTQTPLPKPPASARPARSKPRIGGVVFQFISTMLMINGFKGLEHIDIPEYLVQKGVGLDRFLTNWGLAMAIATTFLGVLSDVLPGVTAIRSVKRAFLMIAFPLAVTISSIYWPLVLIAPFLILPPKSTNPASPASPGEPSSSPETPEMFRLPLWIDLSLHALPTAILFIEFFVREKKYRAPVSTVGAVIYTALFSMAYTGWIEYKGASDGKFPYPFLPAGSLPTRLAIYIGGTVFAYTSFKILNRLHR